MKKFKKKFFKLLKEIESEIKRRSQNRVFNFAVLNFFIIFLEVVYIFLRFKFINNEIPFWYTKLWGDYQLAPRIYIYALPLISAFITIAGLLLIGILAKYFVRYIVDVLTLFISISNIVLAFEVIRTIQIASTPFKPFINPLYFSLFLPFILGFVAIYLITPLFIEFAKDKGIITNPNIHQHPGMILENPSARGGGILYVAVFLVLSLIFVGFTKNFSGFYLSLVLLGILSYVDDYQNTHPYTSFKLVENPLLRLLLLFSVVSLIPMSGIQINVISNPFGDILDLSKIQFNLLSSISPILTAVWIVWFMNVLSWSNGVDGQFSGIAGIASIFVAILSLRFSQLLSIHTQVATMAAISAGASFGLARHTWHPSKIMWGFGAMGAGIVIATLSVLSQTKIITSILIILIPFFDALVTAVRRMFQGKSPLKGDRGHLHHLLMAKGWKVSKIALFYWITTLVFGIISVVCSERYIVQTSLILSGIVAFFIIFLNISTFHKRT